MGNSLFVGSAKHHCLRSRSWRPHHRLNWYLPPPLPFSSSPLLPSPTFLLPPPPSKVSEKEVQRIQRLHRSRPRTTDHMRRSGPKRGSSMASILTWRTLILVSLLEVCEEGGEERRGGEESRERGEEGEGKSGGHGNKGERRRRRR